MPRSALDTALLRAREAEARAEAAQARIAVLEGALRKYGEHHDDCSYFQFNKKFTCDCGLDAALAQKGGETPAPPAREGE